MVLWLMTVESKSAAAKPTKTELSQAFAAELKKDSALTSAFDITEGGDKLTFTSKVAGSAGATISALSVGGTQGAAGGGISATQGDVVVGQDSKQILDLNKVLDGTGNTPLKAEDVQNAIFEVGGKKFLLAKTGSDIANLTGLGSDVTVINTADATYSGQNDGKKVAAEISRITGMEFEWNEKATDNATGIAKYDLVFKGKETLSKGGQSLTLQIGDTSADYNQLEVAIKDCHVATLGIADIDIGTQAGAKAAVDVIKNAINYVSDVRGTLGANPEPSEDTPSTTCLYHREHDSC